LAERHLPPSRCIEIFTPIIGFINLPPTAPRRRVVQQTMLLDKWYLDAVFPDGTVWFGYRASLQLWGGLALAWASGCQVLADGRQHKVARWAELAPPRLAGGQWQWQGPDGFVARWEPSSPGLESDLASDNRFRAHWNCIVPRAVVTRTYGAGTAGGNAQTGQLPGTGYIEHLRLETTLSSLPFRDLWWGRAHAGASTLVWIRWGRGREFSLLVEDGVAANGRFETLPNGGVRVHTARGQWETGCGHALCDRDVRRAFPRALVWLTGGLAPARELKMSGPVRCHTASTECTGSGVWEEVTWL
jgi:hypothetical protein